MSGGALHCAPGRTIQHTAPRAAVPKYRVVYASASRSAMHTPVDVTGIEPARGLCLQDLGLSTFDTHPTILFWLGNRRPRDGRTDALCRLECQRFSECTPRPSLNTGVTTRALCTQGISHCLHRCCGRAGRTSPKLARYHCNQGNFPCPGTGYRRFFSPPLRPI